MPSEIETAINAHRARLLAGEARALATMQSAYLPVRARLLAEIDDLVTLLETGNVTAKNVLKLQRVDTLIRQIEDELQRLSAPAERFLAIAQRAAVQRALSDARALVGAQEASVLASWTRLPTAAVSDLVGMLQDGSPLRSVLDSFGPDASQAIGDALVDGLATGKHPTFIAAELRGVVDRTGARLLTLTRTSMLTSYRTASLRSYAESGVCDGWIWIASLSGDTCAACLSLHMTHHELTESFAQFHVNCRCAPAPSVRGVPFPDMQSGAEWLGSQSSAVQDRVLDGKSAGNAYRSGEVALSDFAHLRRDTRWGDAYVQASLKQARANAAGSERKAAA